MKAGVWLGVAAAFKPFIGLFLITFLLARKTASAISMATSAGILTLLGIIWFGWAPNLEYIQILSDITWTTSNWNASLNGFFSRLLGGAENTPMLQAPHLGRMLIALSSAAVIITIARALIAARCLKFKIHTDIIFGLTIPATLLLAPLGWLYYFPLLCLCLPAISSMHPMLVDGRRHILLIICFCVTAIPRSLEYPTTMNTMVSWWWSGPLYTYAILTLLILSVLGSLRYARSASA